MIKVNKNGGIIFYQDKKGNELRVWEEDNSVLGADFEGINYGVIEAKVLSKSTFYWKVIGKGRVNKTFIEWFENVKKELGDKICTKNLYYKK